MKLCIAAVGRLRPGPEASLVADYSARAEGVGRRLGIGPFRLCEIDDRKARTAAAQGKALLEACQAGSLRVALDERGRSLGSDAFAALLADQRDGGRAEIAFLIGGADGHGDSLRAQADQLLSLGPMVWPHMLVRVMVAEQIYRALSILAGTPYHRA